MTTEEDVRAASKAFYAALNRMLAGDASSLTEIWVHSAEATTMHPIGDRQVGWDQIRESFERVARSSNGGQVAITDQLFRVHGDTAYEVGVERAEFTVNGTRLTVNSRVTNIYYREPGAWKIIHHHGDKSPGISEALDKADRT
jgi:ketosteroid isomerase-like protein